MLTETLLERLQWFKADLYAVSDHELVIAEPNESGKADVVCSVQSFAIAFNGVDGKNFLSLNNLSCADGIVFENYDQDRWKLHIIELKGTIDKKKWKSIKEQFEGALLNAYAIMGILGIQSLDEVKFYTAYKKDRLDPKQSADPIQFKGKLDKSVESESFIEWMSGKVSILSIQEACHSKIEIDPVTAKARVTLA